MIDDARKIEILLWCSQKWEVFSDPFLDHEFTSVELAWLCWFLAAKCRQAVELMKDI